MLRVGDKVVYKSEVFSSVVKPPGHTKGKVYTILHVEGDRGFLSKVSERWGGMRASDGVHEWVVYESEVTILPRNLLMKIYTKLKTLFNVPKIMTTVSKLTVPFLFTLTGAGMLGGFVSIEAGLITAAILSVADRLQ